MQDFIQRARERSISHIDLQWSSPAMGSIVSSDVTAAVTARCRAPAGGGGTTRKQRRDRGTVFRNRVFLE